MKTITLISIPKEVTPICEILFSIAGEKTPLHLLQNPDKEIFIVHGGKDEEDIIRLLHICKTLWDIKLDANMIMKAISTTSGEYIIVFENGIPVMQQCLYCGDEKNIDIFLKHLANLSDKES